MSQHDQHPNTKDSARCAAPTGSASFAYLPSKSWSYLEIRKPKGCKALVVYDVGEYLELELLIVRAGFRNQGVGSEAVRRVQKIGKPIHLIADANRGRKADLVRFYKQHGFRMLDDATMLWTPNAKPTNRASET